MRVLLQSFETGLYLDTSGDWTIASHLARDFPNTRQATEFKIHRRLANIFVVVRPEPAPPVNVNGTQDETVRDAQEPANLVGGRVKAIQVIKTKKGRSVRRKPAMADHQRDSNRQPCSLSV